MATLTLTPTGLYVNDWTSEVPASSNRVTDLTDGLDTTYLYSTNTALAESLSFPSAYSQLVGRTINSITLTYRYALAGSSGITLYLRVGAGTPTFAAFGTNVAFVSQPITYTTNPATGKPWTAADFSAFVAGFNTGNTVPINWAELSLSIDYNLLPQVTADTMGLTRDSDMRHVIESAIVRLNSGGVLQSLRWEIAADSSGGTVYADSGTVTTTATDGQTLSWIHTWTPASSATCYLRVGIVCADHATVYWVYVSIVITLPTITASSIVQNGEYLVATMTVSDPTCATGMMFFAGGDSAPMELDGNTVKGTLWVERGDVTWTMIVVTPWVTLSVQGTMLVTYVPLAGIHLYQDNAELDVSGASFVENICPDVSTCSFTVLSADIDITKPIIVKMHGKRWHMDIRSADDNDDGTTTIRAVDVGHITLQRTVTLSQLPSDSWSIAQLLGLQWKQDYAGALPVLVVDAQWTNTPVKDILAQLALLNQVTFLMHDRSMHVLEQTGDPIFAISKGRQCDFSQVTNHVREEYTIADYPSPASLWSLTPASWTGTVAAAAYTATTRLRPPSGAAAWLKATGTVYIASISAILADYDRFHMYWSPATAGNLTIRLEQDASNYLEKTLTYAGTIATGWLATADSSAGVATHTYNNAYTYSAITLQFDDSCLVRVREVKSGADVYVTSWMQFGTQPVNVPLNPLLSVDSLVVEVTHLHLIDVLYGIRCVAATLQTIQSVVVGSSSGSCIVWQGSANPTGGAIQGSDMSSVPFPAITGDMTVNVIPTGDGSIYVSITKPCTVANTQPGIVPVTILESSPLQQELDIALTDFVKTGNPVTIVKMTLTATGDNYYDAPCLRNIRGTRHSVEVYASGWTQANDRPMIRKSDQWRNASVARDFAQKLCDKYSVPLVGYTETVDWDAPVDIGDVVSTPDGNYVVYSISWNPAEMTKTIAVGERIKNTITWIENMNQNVSDLQRMV